MQLNRLRVTEIQGVFHPHHVEGTINCYYGRKDYGFVFVESGLLRFDYNGKRYYCDNKHILYIPKGINYKLTCEEKCDHFTVNFDVMDDSVMPDNFCSFNAQMTNSVVANLEKLHTTWELHWKSSELTCMSLFYNTLAWLNSISTHGERPEPRHEQILPSIRYLEEHYADPMITNELIAEVSCISTVYFRKLFTEIYGISPMRYVRQKRIEKARSLLENGFTNISEIAESVGFNSIYHFSKTFKQITGVTPSAYAKSSAHEGTSENN